MYGQMTGMRQIKQFIICIKTYKEMFVFTSGAFLQLHLLQFICHAWLVKMISSVARWIQGRVTWER